MCYVDLWQKHEPENALKHDLMEKTVKKYMGLCALFDLFSSMHQHCVGAAQYREEC